MGELLKGFDAYLTRLAAGTVDGLGAVARNIEQDAVETDAYQDDTGATRDSTTAYVIGLGIDDSDRFEAAADKARAFNPDHVDVTTVGTVPDAIGLVVLSTPTDYAIDLERDYGGQHAYLAETLLTGAASAISTIAKAVRRRLGG